MTTSNIARVHENPAACMHASSLTRQDLERRSPGLRTLRLHVANVAPQGCHRELRGSLRGRHLHGCARQHLLVCRRRRLHGLLLELRRVRHLLRPAVPGEQGKGIRKRASAHGRWVHAASIARRARAQHLRVVLRRGGHRLLHVLVHLRTLQASEPQRRPSGIIGNHTMMPLLSDRCSNAVAMSVRA
jgi:hypothetical protein